MTSRQQRHALWPASSSAVFGQSTLLHKPIRSSPLACCAAVDSGRHSTWTPTSPFSTSSSDMDELPSSDGLFSEASSSSSPSRGLASSPVDSRYAQRRVDFKSTASRRPASHSVANRRFQSQTSPSPSSSTSAPQSQMNLSASNNFSATLSSGSKWHDRFLLNCTQRAASDRVKGVNSKRVGLEGDLFRGDVETREELAVLRKEHLRDLQQWHRQNLKAELGTSSPIAGTSRTSMDEVLDAICDMDDIPEEENYDPNQILESAEEPPLDVVAEMDEEAYALAFEEYQMSLRPQMSGGSVHPADVAMHALSPRKNSDAHELDDFDMMLADEDNDTLVDALRQAEEERHQAVREGFA